MRTVPGLVALLVLHLAGGGIVGAEPCPDEPGLDGLACRVHALASRGEQGAVVARRLERARAACGAGRTGLARRRLRSMRRPLAGLGGDADVLVTDALRRATIDRLRRHPCPELVEVLSPRWREHVEGRELFVLVRIAADADPASVAIRLGDGAPAVLDPAQASATQAWVRVPCMPQGLRRLRVTSRSRDGSARDVEDIPVICGGDAVLGAEVDVLVTPDYVPQRLRVSPVRPLRSGATYALVATRRLRTAGGRLRASEAFARAAGLRSGIARGPRAVYSEDPLDPRNPFPSARLVQADGTVTIPDGFSARGLAPVPRLDGVRAFVRRLDGLSAEHRGFSPNGYAVLTFEAAIRLDEVRDDRLFLLEVAPGTDLPALLDALERERGLGRRRVAVASTFPIEDLAGELAAIRAQIRSRPAPSLELADPDPDDARPYGVFHPGDSAFAAFFDGNPPSPVGAMVRGSFRSPDYRENGRFPQRFLAGRVTPPAARIDVLLALPARGAPPHRTVIVQHGFGGDEGIVAQLAGDLTAEGLAVIGIPAPEHGTRGRFLDFFVFDDFNAFGNNFRQATVDLLALTRLLEAGLDVDGDGRPDVSGSALGYLGVSLGGVIGGVFTAVEPAITAAVLNVPGAKLSQLAGAASPLAEPFLARFAAEAGIPVRTCGGDPEEAACTSAATCPPGRACDLNPDFIAQFEAAALDQQTQLDPGDGATYARWLRLEPRAVRPAAVLVQEGIGDAIVANPLTEALARAIALPANRPDDAAGGVAGLWRFPPPEGHGILGVPVVRAQAVRFLASGGTQLSP
jgi:dienelactone hydrolase